MRSAVMASAPAVLDVAPPATPTALTHRTVREQLGAYLDGTLELREHQQVAMHLGWCGSCQAFARTLERTVELLHQLPRVSSPREVREQMRQLVAAVR
jgi:anti-sigma factor RsiW